MRAYFQISCLLFLTGSAMISCQSKYSKETNTTANQLKMKDQFPNHKTAFEKINDQVIIYNPLGEKLLYIDLKRSMYTVYKPDLNYVNSLLKVNEFLYFLPKKVQQNYKFSTGDSETSSGIFSTENTVNELGLIGTSKMNIPDQSGELKMSNVVYHYNRFAELLKVDDGGKIIAEYKYDEGANLLESETAEKSIKYFYNKDNQVIKEEGNKKDKKYILNYTYNSESNLDKKFSDDQNLITEYKYDSSGRLIETIEYTGMLDKNDSQKIINHFIKKNYIYNNDKIIEEMQFEYDIVNPSVLIDKKWKPITIEEQKKLSWQQFRSKSEIPFSVIEKKYTYQSDQIEVTINKFSFSNKMNNGKIEGNKELLDSEIIKYKLDNIGRIIQKEIYNKNKKPVEIVNYFY
ncbi:hypothetical protein [Chryseobacterium lactis]|uniref:hypothetical protein n=1 Tax=Chryseobacterium lactis TaxID=1241981 RepID=UPI00162AF67A|nr:hypothetical protein [Chryseobacterium lactis]